MGAPRSPSLFLIYVIASIIATTPCPVDDTQCQPRDYLCREPSPVGQSSRVCHGCLYAERQVFWARLSRGGPPCSTRFTRAIRRHRHRTEQTRLLRLASTGLWTSLPSAGSRHPKNSVSSRPPSTGGSSSFPQNGGDADDSMDLERVLREELEGRLALSVADTHKKLSSGAGLALLLMVVPRIILSRCLTQLSALSFSGENPKQTPHKNIHNLNKGDRSWEFVSHINWKSIWNALGYGSTKEISKPSHLRHTESRLEEIWYKITKYKNGSSQNFTSSHPEKRCEHPYPSSTIESLVAQPLSIPRLASYQQLPAVLPSCLSPLVLAQAGFKYTGPGTRLTCDSCGSTCEINELSEEPGSPRYHAEGCQFLVGAGSSGPDLAHHQQHQQHQHQHQHQHNCCLGLPTKGNVSENLGALASDSLSSPVPPTPLSSTATPSFSSSGATSTFSPSVSTTSTPLTSASAYPVASGSPLNSKSSYAGQTEQTPPSSGEASSTYRLPAPIETDAQMWHPGDHTGQTGIPRSERSPAQAGTVDEKAVPGATEQQRHQPTGQQRHQTTGQHYQPPGHSGSQNTIEATHTGYPGSSLTGAVGGSDQNSSEHSGHRSRSRSDSSYNSSSSSDSNSSSSGDSAGHDDLSVFVSGSRYAEDAKTATRDFYGSDLFEAEFSTEQQKPFRPERVRVGDCKKNPGHFCYTSPVDVSLEMLPEFARCSQFPRFLNLLSDLTVRLVVSLTSAARGRAGQPSELPGGVRYRTGTGSAIREPVFEEDKDDPIVECDSGVAASAPASQPEPDKSSWSKGSSRLKRSLPKAPVKAMRKCASYMKKRKSVIYVETNRHIVFDDEEAANTTVEFFFDRPDRRSVYSFKVTGVLHDASLAGGNRSFLVCKTSDHSFVSSLREKRRELERLVENFPVTVRPALSKHMFMVHHPHGCAKVFSFGKCVVRKYLLEPGPPSCETSTTATAGGTPSKLTKFADLKQIPSDPRNVRKFLVYSADTCPGSSGAPVIAFTRSGSGADAESSLTLDLWMHEGREITGPLNVSAMEACTAADLVPRAPRPTLTPGPSLSLPPPAPVVRMTNPTYLVYSSLRKRVDSFAGVPPNTFVHPVFDLAKGGFFYAGYSDCVRCFYCGIGLKQWEPNDDMYEEHRRLRPDCSFLILQLRAMGDSRASPSSIAPGQQVIASGSGAASQQASESPAITATASSSVAPASLDKGHSGLTTGAFRPSQSHLEITAYPVTGITYNNSSTNTAENPREDLNFIPSDATPDVTPTGGPPAASADEKSRFQVSMLQTENALLERPLTCKVCNSQPVQELYLPCGHLDSCSECTKNLNNCPTCTAQIKATVKVYFA